MKVPGLLLLTLVLLLTNAQGAGEWFVGTYFGREDMEGRDLERVVEVRVEKEKGEGGAFLLKGGFWYTEGRMPAPDFEGTLLSHDKKAARFSFRDSFANEGVVTLSPEGKGVWMTIRVSQVRHERSLMLYKKIWLKRD